MADSIEVPAAVLDRAVYVAVAGTRDNAETDILAGVVERIVDRRPNVSAVDLSAAIIELRDALVSKRPAHHADLTQDSALLMSRCLTRVVSGLTGPLLRNAARDYARTFLNSYRRGTSLLRQVAPIDLQFDRAGEVEQFRRETWQRLYDHARALPAVAQAIDDGPIGEALGVRTTQDAPTVLGIVNLEPLTTFVAARLQPGGGLLVTRTDIDVTLASTGSNVVVLVRSYASNVVVLNNAEQAPDRDESAFEKAIREAEALQKELNKALDFSAKGVEVTFGLLSFAADEFGDKELAASIAEYSGILRKTIGATKQLAEGAIEIAKAIAGLDEVSLEKVFAFTALGFNLAMIAVVIQISGLLGKPKPPTQIILEQLREIRNQLLELRDEMRVRFDRIEKRLSKVYQGILDRLAEIDFDIGQIEGNVEELQLALYDLHSLLVRLNRNIHGFLAAAHRRDLVEAINGFLRFRERTGEDLSLEDFRTAENVFFSWGHDHAKDVLQAGPEERSFRDQDVASELTSLPLATNVNYLRVFPAERLALTPLSGVRLANPFDWIVAGEAYAQLGEESPSRPVIAERVQELAAVGEALGASLARITSDGLLTSLADHYLASFAALRDAIAAAEQVFMNDESAHLADVDLFGGVDQVPAHHSLDSGFTELLRCDRQEFDDVFDTVPVPDSIKNFDHSALQPYMLATALSHSEIPGVADGLSVLRPCVAARWDLQESGPAPGNRIRAVYRLMVAVNLQYGAAVVFAHRYRTSETMQLLVPKAKFESGTFDPATDPLGQDPHARLVDDSLKLWKKLDSFTASHVLLNEPLRVATIARIERNLAILRRSFYTTVVTGFSAAGDAIAHAATVLDGAKLLLQAFVLAGLPLRIEANEILRALLFGSDAILGGTNEDDDAGLDTVQALYALFARQPEDPPQANIAADIAAMATGRARQLADLLADIVADIETTGEPEPPELFAPTLLRLSLLGTT